MPRTILAPPEPPKLAPEPSMPVPYTPDTVPDAVFATAVGQKGTYFTLDGIDYKIWSLLYAPPGAVVGTTILVPVPVEFGFLGAATVGDAAQIMASAKAKYEALMAMDHVFDEGTGTWVPKHDSKMSVWLIGQAIKQAAQAAAFGVKPGTTFHFKGTKWYWRPKDDLIIPDNLWGYPESAVTIEDMAKTAMAKYGSVLHPDPVLAAKVLGDHYWHESDGPEELTTEMLHAVYQYTVDNKIPSGGGNDALFELFGHQWWHSHDEGPLPNHMSDFLNSHAWDWYGKEWKEWKAATTKSTWPKYPTAMTVTTDDSANIAVNFLTSVATTNATSHVAAPPFPGPSGKMPKWGPATAHFEAKLAEALKLRLGPYATDSMVAAVTEDMLPVLRAYWDEVNTALVALKMTAAEQDKDVPSSIPGWKPSEEQKIPEPQDAPSPKVEAATAAIWKASLSPYLKKQYTQRIAFGMACGALPEGTTLETPYIDLWIMAVKKHSKKGEPPMAEDYHAATKQWQTALEGITE